MEKKNTEKEKVSKKKTAASKPATKPAAKKPAVKPVVKSTREQSAVSAVTEKTIKPMVAETPTAAQSSAASTSRHGITETIVKTFLITSGLIIASFFFILSTMFVIAPEKLTGVYDYIGAKEACFTLYERIYNRTGENEDLYNVLQYAIQNKRYEDVIVYSKEMLNKKDFKGFAAKVDAVSIESMTDNYSYTVASYEAYIKNNLVVALYNTKGNEAEAKIMACESLFNQTGFCFELGAYIDCIRYDPLLTTNDKRQMLKNLYNNYTTREKFELLYYYFEEEFATSGENSENPFFHNLIQSVIAYEKLLCESVSGSTPDSRLTAIEAWEVILLDYIALATA